MEEPTLKTNQYAPHLIERVTWSPRHLVTAAIWLWPVLAALVVGISVFTAARVFPLLATPCDEAAACASPRLFVAHAAMLAAYGFGPTSYALVLLGLWSVVTLGGAAVGGVIFWHARGDRSALLGAYTLLLYGLANTPLLDVGGGTAWGWTLGSIAAWIVGDAVLIYFCALFPSGHLVPRFMRWMLPVLVALDIALAVYAHLVPLTFDAVVGLYGFIVGWMSVLVAAQLYRYRFAASAVERQQTRAIVAALVLCLGVRQGMNLVAILMLHGADSSAFFGARLFVRMMDGGLSVLLPLLFGIALLRHRLYNIEIVINRAVVYGLLTSCVVALYMLLVGGMSVLLHSEDNIWISLLATGVVAALFQPLRMRLQRAVNRLLYGERDDPYAVLTRLGQQLQASADADAMLPSVVVTVRDALKLPYVALALRQDDTFVSAAAIGTAPARPLVIPLRYQHTDVGQLLLGQRGSGAPFTPADERLLHDLARHIGIAIHAVRLTEDLQHSRERLVTAREEERRRLRRDLHDGLGPTLASLTMQVDTARALIDDDPATVAQLLVEVQTEMKATISTVRHLVYALRPPALDQFGLLVAIREHAARALATHGVAVSFVLPDALPSLPAAVEVAAYYIVVEATTNVVRHARAQRCAIILALTETTLEISITDDGVGLPDVHHSGVGLTTMRERAEELGGTCRVTKELPCGTRIRAILPLRF